jgi:hypothetical protein
MNAAKVEGRMSACLQRHHLLNVVDTVSPELPLRWRRASTFCKALLKKSSSIVFSASSRFKLMHLFAQCELS